MKRLRLVRNLRLGIKSLLLHKLRSCLTMLGVVFGVGSVIAMLAVGEGASKEALEQIRSLGSHNIMISAAKPMEEEEAANVQIRMSVYGLQYEDEKRIAETIPSVRRTVPAKMIRREGRLGERSLELRVVGTTQDWFELVAREAIAGRVLTAREVETKANGVVLTEYGARRLLATRASIGELLRIGRDSFEVIGIVKSETRIGGGVQTPDQQIDAYIGLPVARERFGDIFTKTTAGTRTRELVLLHEIIVEVWSIDEVEATASALEALLKRFHKKKDYRISVPLALLRQAEATKRTFNIVLGSIAAISLVVGGIGIMNIMLATVTERTREIGIRRAIGAKRRQIVEQFLVETVVLSISGGLIGVAIGLLIPRIISGFAGMATVVSPYSVVLALGISVGIGILFGLYPAVRAARLDPIEALRHD